MTGRPPKCRIPGCINAVRAGQLMCREHWRQVPQPLQRGINDTWARRDMTNYAANVRAAERLILAKENP